MISRDVFLLCSYLACLVAGRPTDHHYSGIGDLSFRLLEKTVKGDENTVHSAYSIYSALGMCLLGAQGETLESMKSSMGLALLSDDEIKASFKASTDKILRENKFILETANRLLVNKSFQVKNQFKDEVQAIFNASAFNVDFTHEGDSIQKSTNEFVKEKTHGLIPEILSSPLSENTKMALVNALYFKGEWEERMETAWGQDKFNAHTCESGQPIVSNQKANWMKVQGQLAYAESAALKATFVELPYRSDKNSELKASMIAILPSEEYKCDLHGWVKQNLKWSNFVDAVKSMRVTELQVRMPKTNMEADFELSKTLPQMGMAPAFSTSANFNSMVESGNANLRLDQVIHKAKMIVDEEGTEAAASTVVSVVPFARPALPIPAKPVYLNRSFVALIVLRGGSNSIVPVFTSVVNRL